MFILFVFIVHKISQRGVNGLILNTQYCLFSRTKTNSAANNGKWHHICLVWTSEGGMVTLHNDWSIFSGTRFSEGETIPGMHSCHAMALLLWVELETK